MLSFKFSNRPWLLALVAPLLMLAVAWSSSPASKDAYTNTQLGFTMAPPTFAVGLDVKVASVASFSAPPVNGFADNLNLQLHKMPLAEFCKVSDAQFKDGAITLVSSKDLKLGAAAAHEYHYRAKMNGFDLEFLGVGVASGDDTVLLTATALQSDFAKVEPTFRAAIESFRLEK